MKQEIAITRFETDLGLMIAAASEKGICLFEYADSKHLDLEMKQLSAAFKAPFVEGNNPHTLALKEQIAQYFNGGRREFDLPMDLVGTEFQKQAWLALLKIPCGCTTTYGRQAALIGRASSVRAVANANGRNKISIILPCHRVIGADGTLTGYGGGLWRKKKLLDMEKKLFKF
ncbi:MAG: methylated-DNA--[protein]-cysteine S-methyltransferase [Dysgonamonadaceae bacterium]|jgi:AraC family transcriptional regulator of adaptative response/methylated-DNA-[protein]-cysteine methyltransferase|nr:methylated-DNA--[protein]-cysteine S-methyltransferase [Dysgonamonadaceae bacterium]